MTRLSTMHRMMLGLALLLPTLHAPSQTADAAQTLDQRTAAWQRRYEQTLQLHLRGVVSGGQARELYAAALLWPDGSGMVETVTHTSDPKSMQGSRAASKQQDERAIWLQAAIDARPRDRLVARFEAAGCIGVHLQCDPAGALAFLLREEPDNAAIQLMAFADAQRRQDGKAERRYWSAAAMADRYDTANLELTQLLVDTMDGLLVPPMDGELTLELAERGDAAAWFDPQNAGALTAMATYAAVAIPSFLPETRYCSDDLTHDDSERSDQCKAVFALMARDGNDLITKLVALGVMTRLTAGTPPQLSWDQQKRQMRWLMHRASGLLPPFGDVVPTDQFIDWQVRAGEVVAWQRLLEAAGVPLTPPTGWNPDLRVAP